MNNIISLRQFIDSWDEFDNVKAHTFCRLMKKVSEAIDRDNRNIIRINLDEIKINVITGDIVFSDSMINMDRTVAGINTGISLMADRKSSKEHKRVALALMILGWYCNDDGSSVISDINVLENFDYYMSMVPTWLQDFFVGVFRRMDYDTSFSDYYKKNFIDVVNNQINEAFKLYDLPKAQMDKIKMVILRRIDNKVLGGDLNA